jgi:uncharacterized protein (TIGR02145 family)
MTIWTNEIKELDKIYESFKGHIPDIVKEMEQLIKTDDPNVVMLYSRRCLEVIVTDLCEIELKRPRKTEPLKGIIDKLNSEEKVPGHIITSMLSLNSMATYGTHPKDFDPEQVKPVLNNLAIIIRWYLKYKDFKIVSKTETVAEEKKTEYKKPVEPVKEAASPKRSMVMKVPLIILGIIIMAFIIINFITNYIRKGQLGEKIKWTGEVTIDQRDNKIYKVVRIGEQVWMAENLKATKYTDGTDIPKVTDKTKWNNLNTPAYCWYNNDGRNYGVTYGPLYNWFTVNTGKLCPAGWHVPSYAEWRALTEFLGDSISWTREVAGNKLKEAGNIHWAYNDTINATDDYKFSALPGGGRTIYGVFYDIGESGNWWSSTEDPYSKGDAQNVEMNSIYSSITHIQQYKQSGMSVRCLQDTYISDIDNNSYKTVNIGNQVWMAENLKTTRLNDGTPILPGKIDSSVLYQETYEPGYFSYDDQPGQKANFGALYNWYAVNTGKLCPTGWHVPSEEEWTRLNQYLGGDSIAGGRLKESGINNWVSPNKGATNSSGFTALPGGYVGGGYNNIGYGSYFWSSTVYVDGAGEESPTIARGKEIYTYKSSINDIIKGRETGMSVRCIKDGGLKSR